MAWEVNVEGGSQNEEQFRQELEKQLRTILYLKDRLRDPEVSRMMEEMGIPLEDLNKTYKAMEKLDKIDGAKILGVSEKNEMYMLCKDDNSSLHLLRDTQAQAQIGFFLYRIPRAFKQSKLSGLQLREFPSLK